MRKIEIEPGDGTHYELFFDSLLTDYFAGFRAGSCEMIKAHEFTGYNLLHSSYVQEKLEIKNPCSLVVATVAIATALGRPYGLEVGLAEGVLRAYPDEIRKTEQIIKEALDIK